MNKIINSKLFKFGIIVAVILIQINIFSTKTNSVTSSFYKESNEQVNYAGVVNVLNDFYESLVSEDTYVLDTDKFLCTGTNVSCASSTKYNAGIGLLNLDEFNAIGEEDSYLIPTNSYWTMTEAGSNTYKITSESFLSVLNTTSSGVRPTIYLKNDSLVTGYGYSYDPYVLQVEEEE